MDRYYNENSCDKINLYNSYKNLPGRVILDCPFYNSPQISYGIIAYAIDTSKWFLIKRKDSIEFTILVRGLYKLSELKNLLNEISYEENKLLFKCLNNDISFKELYTKVFNFNRKNYEYAELRFNECKNIILKNIYNSNPKNNTEWLWPKGKLTKKKIKETPEQCAIREFEEESGIPITNQICISKNPIIHEHKGSDNKLYHTHLFIFIFKEQINPQSILNLDNPGEIGDRKWVSKDNALSLLSNDKINILNISEYMIKLFLSFN